MVVIERVRSIKIKLADPLILLVGQVKAEFRHSNDWFEAHAAAGAGIVVGADGGLPSEVTIKLMLTSDEEKVDFKGEVDFKGLKLFFMSFATASINKKETEGDVLSNALGGGDDEDDDDKQEDLKEQLEFKESKELWEIFKPKNKKFWED